MEKILLNGCYKEGRVAKRGGRHFLDFTIADAHSHEQGLELPFIHCCFSGADLFSKALSLRAGMKVSVTAHVDPERIKKRSEVDEITISELSVMPC